MKKIILSINCIVIAILSNAQSPSFQWAKQMGGSACIDKGFSVAIDAFGNVYTTGTFSGTTDFDPSAGIFNLTAAGTSNIFISKLDAAGNFVWAKSMGETGVSDYVIGYAIAIDIAGNVYSTGYFFGTIDFDPGVGVVNLTSANGDAFISKLDSSGNFIWVKNMGGTAYNTAAAIAVDTSGNVYTTGYFGGTTDFNPGAGIFNLTSVGDWDIFISKLDNAGNFVWAKSIGDWYTDIGSGIAIDDSGNVYTTGFFYYTPDFDPGSGINNLTSVGNMDIFILKLNSSGNFVWAKGIGGPSTDEGTSIVLDASSNVYTTGYFVGTVDFDPGGGTFNLTSASVQDVFISKLDTAGNFVWAKNMCGSGGYSVLDALGNIYTTGYFQGTGDFDPGVGIFNLSSSAGYDDVFISKIDSSGNFVWAKNMGGTADVYGFSIAVDASNNIYTTGRFQGTTDFDSDIGVFNLTCSGTVDVFVLKMSQTPTGINENIKAKPLFNLFPNPNNGNMIIRNSIKSSDKAEMKIYDLTGKLISNYQLDNATTEMQIHNDLLNNGIYFYQISVNNRVVQADKIIIIK